MQVKSIIASVLSLPVLFAGGMTMAVMAVPVAAQAQVSAKAVVDKAIADGIVGETAAGYLALVNGSASPAVTNAMNEINIGRKSVYTRRAREQGVSIEVLAALTGEKQLAKAKPGTKVLTQQGWVTVN